MIKNTRSKINPIIINKVILKKFTAMYPVKEAQIAEHIMNTALKNPISSFILSLFIKVHQRIFQRKRVNLKIKFYSLESLASSVHCFTNSPIVLCSILPDSMRYLITST